MNPDIASRDLLFSIEQYGKTATRRRARWARKAASRLEKILQKEERWKARKEQLHGIVQSLKRPVRTFLNIAAVTGAILLTAPQDTQSYVPPQHMARTLPIPTEIHSPAPPVEDFVKEKNVSAPIAMYHHIGHEVDRFTVSPQSLWKDLDWLRMNKYEPITFSEYAMQDYDTQRPVILTFDDGTKDHFNITEDGIDPDCAIGVLERYRILHPEWPLTATFFVNAETQDGLPIFEQPGLEKVKLTYLTERGYEIGAHGFHHDDFAKLGIEGVVADLIRFEQHMHEWLPEYEIKSFAYPYGSLPDKQVQDIVQAFYPATAHAWGGVASGEKHNVPRIELGPLNRIKDYAPRHKPL